MWQQLTDTASQDLGCQTGPVKYDQEKVYRFGSSGQHLPLSSYSSSNAALSTSQAAGAANIPVQKNQPACAWAAWKCPLRLCKIVVKRDFCSDKADLSRDKVMKQEQLDFKTMIREKERQVCFLQQVRSLGHLNAKSNQSPVSRKRTKKQAWIMPACGLKSDLLRYYFSLL